MCVIDLLSVCTTVYQDLIRRIGWSWFRGNFFFLLLFRVGASYWSLRFGCDFLPVSFALVLGTLALRLGVAALTMVVFVFSYRFVLWRLPDDCRIHSLCVVLCSLNILFAFALILCTLTYRLPQQPHSNGLPIVLVPYETINVARVATCCSSNHSAYSDRTGSDTSGEPGTNCGAGSCLNWISSLQLLDLVKLLLLQPRVVFGMRWVG